MTVYRIKRPGLPAIYVAGVQALRRWRVDNPAHDLPELRPVIEIVDDPLVELNRLAREVDELDTKVDGLQSDVRHLEIEAMD